jgi:hypothetical protein
MGWEQRRGILYYYRSEWRAGRCVKRYIGRGAAGEAAAREDEERRLARAVRRHAAEVERALERPARDLASQLDAEVKIAIQTVLVAGGFRQHARGKWRRRRATTAENEQATGST